MKYRPEIDGLRAISVLAVVIFHAEFSTEYFKKALPGGYLGVDVFFVISGYLLTTIIVDELNVNKFSYATFYERRARRILPVFLTVVACTTVVAWKVFFLSEFREYCNQVISSFLFVSNFYFWSEDPYWATDSNLKPLLHTWSLAVEEQFYIILPPILFIVHKFAKTRMCAVFSVICLISMSAAQYYVLQYSQTVFYLLPCRLWELMLGSVLSLLNLPASNKMLDRVNNYGLCWLGLFLIVFPMFYYTEDTLHPSYLTCVPLIGASIIIKFSNESSYAVKLLGSRPFVWVGLLSYGIYMWHFPILALARNYLYSDFSTQHKFAGLVATFVLSICSYFTVESYLRDKKTVSLPSFTRACILLSFPTIYIGVLGSIEVKRPIAMEQEQVSVNNEGYSFRNFDPSKYHPDFYANYWLAGNDYLDTTLTDMINTLNQKSEKTKKFSWNGQSGERLIVVGDSHAEIYARALVNVGGKEKASYRVADFSNNDCPFILDVEILKNRKTLCKKELAEKVLAHINKAEPSIVLFAGRLSYLIEEEEPEDTYHTNRFNPGAPEPVRKKSDLVVQNPEHSLKTKTERQDYMREQIHKTMQAVASAGHKIIVVYPVPELGFDGLAVLKEEISTEKPGRELIKFTMPVTVSYDQFKEFNNKTYSILNSIPTKVDERIYPDKLFCNAIKNAASRGRCTTHDMTIPLYKSSNHLTKYGAEFVVKSLITQISKNSKINM